MKNNVYREKSVERVSSPEQLNDYIKVSNPGIWIILFAVIALLVGFIVWGVVARLETKLSVVAVSTENGVVCYVKEGDFASVEKGQTIRIGDKDYTLKELPSQPVSVGGDLGEYALHVGGLREGEWVFPVVIDASLKEGIYPAEIVIDSVSPISFLFN